MDIECFPAMDVDGKKNLMFDKNNVQRDTALGTWK